MADIRHVYDFTFLEDFFLMDEGKPVMWLGPERSGFDIETEGVLNPHDGEIATLQFELGGTCWIVQVPYDCVTAADLDDAHLLRAYIECEDVKKEIHNAKFELKWMFKTFSEDLMPANIYCTQVGEYVLAEGDPRVFTNEDNARSGYFTLGGTMLRRFGLEMDKDDDLRTSFRRGLELTDRQKAYAAEDVLYMDQLYEAQKADMDLLAMQGVRIYNVLEIDLNSVEALARMEYEGLPVNIDKLRALRDEIQAEIDELEGPLHAIFDPAPVFVKGNPRARIPERKVDRYEFTPIKLNAWQQMIPAIEALGYDLSIFVKGNPRDKDPKKQVDHIEKKYSKSVLKQYKGDDIIDQLLRWKELTKLISSFIDKIILAYNPVTGRVYTDFNGTVTSTGRLSSSGAFNGQNLPSRTELGARLRACFEAPPGYKFVGGDYANIEMKLIAEMFNEPKLIEAFNKDMDVHALTAAGIEGLPYEEVVAGHKAGDPKYKIIRQSGKPANFGLGYGMGLDRFLSMVWDQYDMKWTREFGQKVREGYLNNYTGIRSYHNRRKQELKNGSGWFYVETQDGRRHMCNRDGGYSASLNSPVQGSSADMGRKVLWQACRKMRLILQVHDEFWALAKEEDAEATEKLLKQIAESIGQTYLPRVPIRFDSQIADCWVH